LLCWLGLAQTLPTVAQGTVPPLLYLPVITQEVPAEPGVYDAVLVASRRGDNRPAAHHADLNLALRGYTDTVAALNLIDLGGDTVPDAPQLAGLFAPLRLPTFLAAYQVYDWDWGCGPDGCRGDPLTLWEVTLLEVATMPDEPLFIPTREPEIHGGGYRALVIYAESTRLTLVYTRHDGVEIGYAVHLEDLEVDAGLLALYEALDVAGRTRLPALRNGERLGYADGASVKVAIRDTGQFMDPRVRKDWWMSYVVAVNR
jgi:hypothetical protein